MRLTRTSDEILLKDTVQKASHLLLTKLKTFRVWLFGYKSLDCLQLRV